MSYSDDRVDQMYKELQVVTESILQLNLEQEESIELLVKWQTRQQELRESIIQARKSANQIPLPEPCNSAAFECLKLEESIQQKLSAEKDSLNRKIANIKMGDKAKEAYNHVYAQADGYFIDKHK